jgi:carbonic anhydrase
MKSLLILVLSSIVLACEMPKDHATTALGKLIEGNERFVNDQEIHVNQNATARLKTIKNQKPFAAIVTCSDSRIAPELIFDHGIGDLFEIRTAGNIMGEIELASLEYAVEHLGVQAVVILGHEDCGAISAFVNHSHEHGHIASLIHTIESEIEEKQAIKQNPKHRLNACIIANIKHQNKYILENSDIIRAKLNSKKLVLVNAEYSQKTGKVSIIKS